MCPGPNQDMVNFCTCQEGSWLGLGGYSIPPHKLFGGWGKEISSLKRGSLPDHMQCWKEWSGIVRDENSCENHLLLLHSFIGIFAITVWFFMISFIFPVSKLFFFQPAILTFSDSNSPFRPTSGGQGGQIGVQVNSIWFGVSLWKH